MQILIMIIINTLNFELKKINCEIKDVQSTIDFRKLFNISFEILVMNTYQY